MNVGSVRERTREFLGSDASCSNSMHVGREERETEAVLGRLRSNPFLTLITFTFAFIIREIPYGDCKVLECKIHI